MRQSALTALLIRSLGQAAFLMLCACEEKPEQATPAPDEAAPTAVTQSAQAASSPTPTALMEEHFSRVTDMKAAAIRGDMAAFKEAAGLLATRQLTGDVAPEWKVHLQAMQDAARSGRNAADIAAAAAALGETGRACAACHEALGKPEVTIGEPPAEGSGARPHMARHEWAVDRMWEGLMGPSDEAWVSGSEVLGDAPLQAEAMVEDKTVNERIATLAKETHQAANRARTAPKNERSRHFGDLVAMCESCHSQLDLELASGRLGAPGASE